LYQSHPPFSIVKPTVFFFLDCNHDKVTLGATLTEGIVLRLYYSVSFSVDSRRDRRALEQLIPEAFRPKEVFNHFEAGLSEKWIEGDDFIWEPYVGVEFPLYAVSVRKADGTDFTHEEMMAFLQEYARDISPLVFVQARSNNQMLQEAIDTNSRNCLPWYFDLPEV
jgi:hypothetical protein